MAIITGTCLAAEGLGLLPAQAAGPIAVPCGTSALAAAISTAPSGSLLALAPHCTYGVMTALPVIGTNLSMLGSFTTIQLSTLAADPASPLLAVSPAGDLAVTNVNFSDGDAVDGGAILNDGTLSINGGLFSENRANDSGGAVYNAGRLAATGAIFTGNSASAAGGAILSTYRATIRNCQFTGNSAQHGGATANEAPEPGPDRDVPDAPLPLTIMTVTGSSFTGNTAESGGADAGISQQTFTSDSFIGNGNATTQQAGAILATNGVLTLSHSTLSGNQAGNGGAVLVNPVGTFSSDNITGNTATVEANGNGGGIYFTGLISVSNNKISNNYAVDDGGGIFAQGSAEISGTQIFKNQAGNDGGGIFNRDGTITLSRSPVYTNKPDNCAPVGSVPGCAG